MTSTIWNKAFTITTVSLHGHTYVVNIYTKDAVDSVVELQPAKEAFSFEIDNNEDVFTTVRGSTGYIRYINDGNNYDVFPSEMLDRYVEVTKNGDVFWQGFLVPSSYTQPYDAAPLEVEIPCQCLLNAMGNLRMEIPATGTTETTFALMLVEAFDSLMGETTSIMENVYFPRMGSGSTFYIPWFTDADIFRNTIYKLGFCNYDIDSPSANTQGYIGWSWKDVIEEYLKLFGMSVYLWGTDLYLTIPTREDDYSKYPWDRLRNGGNSVNVYAAKETFLLTVAPNSTSNTYSRSRGKGLLRINVGCENFDYGVEIEKDRFYSPTESRAPFQYRSHYLLDADCRDDQPNLTLEDGLAKACMFDIWKMSEDDEHLFNSYTKAIKIKGNPNTAPPTIYQDDCVVAFTLTGHLPFNGIRGDNGLIITGHADKNYGLDNGSGQYILASLRMGDYWWAGGRWMSEHEAQSLGARPTFLIFLDNNGNISTNLNITDPYVYQTHSSKSGYLMPLGGSDWDYGLYDWSAPPILTIYEPFGYANDDYQYITDLKLEYTSGVSASTTIGIDYPALEIGFGRYWAHKRMSNTFENQIDPDNDEEYSSDFNVCTYENQCGWYAPDPRLLIAGKYFTYYYSKPSELIEIGDAYAPGLLPNTLLKQNNIVHKMLSFGMNTYDDCGTVRVFITTIGTE